MSEVQEACWEGGTVCDLGHSVRLFLLSVGESSSEAGLGGGMGAQVAASRSLGTAQVRHQVLRGRPVPGGGYWCPLLAAVRSVPGLLAHHQNPLGSCPWSQATVVRWLS